jgi:hypothetical protein
MLRVEIPKLSLENSEKRVYVLGLGLLGIVVQDTFFDIPRISGDIFSQSGLFYRIPYFDSDMLCSTKTQCDLLVVYKVENGSVSCPLRLEFRYEAEDDLEIIIKDQSKGRTVSKTLLLHKGVASYSAIDDLAKLTLTGLVYLGYEGYKIG